MEDFEEDSKYYLEEYENFYDYPEEIQTRKCKKQVKANLKKTKVEEKERREKIVELLTDQEWDKLEKFLGSLILLNENNDLINKSPLDNEGNTLLHVAARNKLNKIFRILLENGADPCLKNKQQLTPYQCGEGKEVRRILRRFARRHPNKYNYNEAGLPGFEEIPQKVRVKRYLRSYRHITSEAQVDAFKSLPKNKPKLLNFDQFRAEIANRYYVVVSKCFICGECITGKYSPFCVGHAKFCSIDCCQAYRSKLELNL